MSHLVIQWCTIFLFSVLYKIPVFSVVQNSCFQWCTIFLYEMLYLSLFCFNLSYKSLDVWYSGGGVVPNSDVTMSSLFRDLYSIEADMLFEAKNNCSMTSKNAGLPMPRSREGGARSTPLMLGSWPAVGRRVSCLPRASRRLRSPPRRWRSHFIWHPNPSLFDHSRFGAYPRSSRILLSVEPRIEGAVKRGRLSYVPRTLSDRHRGPSPFVAISRTPFLRF